MAECKMVKRGAAQSGTDYGVNAILSSSKVISTQSHWLLAQDCVTTLLIF